MSRCFNIWISVYRCGYDLWKLSTAHYILLTQGRVSVRVLARSIFWAEQVCKLLYNWLSTVHWLLCYCMTMTVTAQGFIYVNKRSLFAPAKVLNYVLPHSYQRFLLTAINISAKILYCFHLSLSLHLSLSVRLSLSLLSLVYQSPSLAHSLLPCLLLIDSCIRCWQDILSKCWA